MLIDLCLELCNRPGILEVSRQSCCRGTCQISKRYDNANYQSPDFKTRSFDRISSRILKWTPGGHQVHIMSYNLSSVLIYISWNMHKVMFCFLFVVVTLSLQSFALFKQKSLPAMASGWPLTSATWWRHQMETFSALLALCAGNSPVPVKYPHKGQWRGALMFPLICVCINGWVNNREAGDSRHYRGHYDVNVMKSPIFPGRNMLWIQKFAKENTSFCQIDRHSVMWLYKYIWWSKDKTRSSKTLFIENIVCWDVPTLDICVSDIQCVSSWLIHEVWIKTPKVISKNMSLKYYQQNVE